MKFAWVPGLCAILMLASASSQARPARTVSPFHHKKPVPIIFDSDIGPDVDDAGAAAILNAMADNGEAQILAMACCTSSDWGAPCLAAINTYYGRRNVPIGTYKGTGFLTSSKYNQQVARLFPNDLQSGTRAPDATSLYRHVLSRQKDHSVVFCATGPLNNLRRLLDSGPDSNSKLNGIDLVAKKVAYLVSMGGRFPEGKEWNFEQDPAAAARVAADWPTPILFSGFEIGSRIHTGARLDTETPAGNPVRTAFALYVGAGKDRESWDETAVLAAVRGPGAYWDLRESGSLSVDGKDATDHWLDRPDRGRAYLVERGSPDVVKKAIEDLMVQRPKRGR